MVICQKCGCLLKANEGYEVFRDLFLCEQCLERANYLRIWGSSDDLVEIDGVVQSRQVSLEFDCYDCGVFGVMKIGSDDGGECLIYGYYSPQGMWCFFPSRVEGKDLPGGVRFINNPCKENDYSMELGILFLTGEPKIEYLMD